MKLAAFLTALAIPTSAFASGMLPVAALATPVHLLSQSGHIVGGIIVVCALFSHYRQKDGS
ncbi:MAG: hypothetical protein AB8B47_09275 [Roseobacter sp.]